MVIKEMRAEDLFKNSNGCLNKLKPIHGKTVTHYSEKITDFEEISTKLQKTLDKSPRKSPRKSPDKLIWIPKNPEKSRSKSHMIAQFTLGWVQPEQRRKNSRQNR